MTSEHDQLPVGLIAQLVEHCTGIAEVMGSNLIHLSLNNVQFFFFRNSLVAQITARILCSL